MKLLIHGGFFSELDQSSDTKLAKQKALSAIVQKGYEFLKNNTAIDTVAYTVSLLENDPLFNAGLGSQIQADGKIRMSASLMNGATLKFSGVMNIEDVQNPIFVAKTLMNEDDRVLGGRQALDYARNHGFEYYNPEIPERRKNYELKLEESKGKGTVGCVALDAVSNLAAATSTGGKGFEIPGRISDSATTAGNYANKKCAISCTGVGEDIVSAALASSIVLRHTDGMSLEQAFIKSFDQLKPIEGFAGAIGLTNEGDHYYLDSYPSMVYAVYDGQTLDVFE